MTIFWLGETDCHDAALVGEKAAVLSRLAADYHVPVGFCLPVHALAQEDGVEATTRQTAVTIAYQTLAEQWGSDRTTLVVRPSYTAGQAAAQREPILANGVVELLAAAERCWQAARAEHLLTGRPMALASVLVQPLVTADVTVRLYSLNPMNGNQQEIVVEAAWGLPEGIIGCEAGRDRFVLKKSDLALVEQTITDKRQMVLALPGGPREVKVPHYLRQQAVLSLSQVVEAAALALALADTLGRPVEAECAYQDKLLYLLNCRVGRPVVGTAGHSVRLRHQALTLLAL